MAPALNLPAPRNDSDNGDGLYAQADKGKAAHIEDVDEVTEQSTTAAVPAAASGSAAAKYATGGIIYPPPELRAIVDKTANYVARNGTQFESKIRGDGTSSRLAFLNETDPYHAYYRAKIEAITAGQGPLAVDSAAGAASTSTGDAFAPNGQVLQADGEGHADALREKEETSKPKEPSPYLFAADLPTVTAVDLDIVKLTALFVARRGRSFASALAAREGRSYQFEFLRPTHSLFGFFNRLVEQYHLVMEPSSEMLDQIRTDAFATADDQLDDAQPTIGIGRGGARLKVLAGIEARADYQKWEREKRKMAEDEEAKERAAFNEVDWNDFVVAGTVELTETDAHIDLPPPMSLREVRNMSMAQKRMASMIMEVEGNSEEAAFGTVGLVDRPGDAVAEVATKAAEEDDIEMDVDDSEEEEAAAKSVVRPAPAGPMKIRKDYQPKTLAERKAAAAAQTTVCPVCGETVSISEMDEHVRIELLNPQFREQRRDLESKRAQHTALLEGANPSEALRQFAGKRTDIFGDAAEEQAQKRRAQEEARKRKERETLVWDGHAASRNDTARGFHQPQAMQQDMAQIQKRFKTDQSRPIYGPQGVPGQAPISENGQVDGIADVQEGVSDAAAVAEMPEGAATFTAGPTAGSGGPPPGAPTGPASLGNPLAPVNAPTGPRNPYSSFNHHVGSPSLQSPQVPGVQSPSTGQMQSPQPAGEGTPAPALEKPTDGKLHPESTWLAAHPAPITINVQLPDSLSVSAKYDGSVLTFGELPLTTTIRALRDRIQAEIFEGSIGASRLKLRIEGNKATTLSQTLAHWNLDEGDTLTLNVS